MNSIFAFSQVLSFIIVALVLLYIIRIIMRGIVATETSAKAQMEAAKALRELIDFKTKKESSNE